MANEFKIKRGFISEGDGTITGSLQVTGTVSGSFIGDGSGLTGIGAGSRISFASVTASVEDSQDIFLISSASIELFKLSSSGAVTLQNNATDVFLIKNLNNDNILAVSQSGVITIATSSVELTGAAPNGGIYFTSSSFFVGLSD
tara:strand:+ start:313 stop:744 length:432 start_codon:yes stop_codon:yes gene_type:complete